jgi:hypothetical protein
LKPISSPYLTERKKDEDQWKWILGSKFYSINQKSNVSPKLRVPAYRYVFKDFLEKNKINATNFVAVGSLAKGGLSNAWGCGVARLSEREMDSYPFSLIDIEESYEIVARRIGISGANPDDLSDYFGLDRWSQPPIEMDQFHSMLFKRYLKHREMLNLAGFKLGRSRVAAISRNLGNRKACDLSGNCLWGCHKDSLYSAAHELTSLLKFPNFKYKSGFIVDEVIKSDTGVVIKGEDGFLNETIVAKRIFLAAGTLATTRLALNAIKFRKEVQLQSCPTAAFLLWLPKKVGAPKSNGFGLGQLSFSYKLNENISAFGSTFSTSGLPVSEFVRHIPFSKRFGIDFFRTFLDSCLVGNAFLPGFLSTTKVSVSVSGVLNVSGGVDKSVSSLMGKLENVLRKNYWKMGAVLLPGSFSLGSPGGDIHYSSTLPMRIRPQLGETNVNGELFGLNHVYVIDGACLTSLSEKSHTLTIMANADRIGRIVTSQIKDEKRNE